MSTDSWQKNRQEERTFQQEGWTWAYAEKKKKEYLSSLARAKGYIEDEWKINLEIMDCNQIEKAYENSRVKSLQLIQ